MKKKGIILLVSFLLVFILSQLTPYGMVSGAPGSQDTSLVNTAHLDHLYQKITAGGKEMGIIYIYADAPEYKWTEAPGEGISCVDDVARAAIVYLRYHAAANDSVSLAVAKSLLEFLFYMQDKNGMFYNFILKDYSINKTRENSVAKADWWTWRAMWALAEAYRFFKGKDAAWERRTLESFRRALPAVGELTKKRPRTRMAGGLRVPDWLPYGCAADQAAVILLALTEYYAASKDAKAAGYMRSIAAGIMQMQQGDSLKFPHGAFLSWENQWHAWGNNQAEALLKAGEVLKDSRMIKRALKEADHFYRYMINEKYFSEFRVNDGRGVNIQKYPQIAYGMNPMISACLAAHRITRNTKYAETAADMAAWFFGRNAARKKMYDPLTGRGYDGIESAEKVNYNSGAESTIEALMALLALEQDPEARRVLGRLIEGKEE